MPGIVIDAQSLSGDKALTHLASSIQASRGALRRDADVVGEASNVPSRAGRGPCR
ncbi:MAG: hypothetical protein AB1416_01435 [Actinomycetota bacterium]